MPSVEKLAIIARILGCGLDDIVCYGKEVGTYGSDRLGRGKDSPAEEM